MPATSSSTVIGCSAWSLKSMPLTSREPSATGSEGLSTDSVARVGAVEGCAAGKWVWASADLASMLRLDRAGRHERCWLRRTGSLVDRGGYLKSAVGCKRRHNDACALPLAADMFYFRFR
jgi:hypothetical protein